jgi:folate-binding protein YgfZ
MGRRAVFGRVRGTEVARHYGDPAAEYRAAREGLAIRDRSHRARLLVRGRAPIAALQGVFTGRMPSAPSALRKGLVRARIEYSAVLTPKGRMIADLRAMWGPNPDEESLFLDVPAAALEPLLVHLRRFVPPRLASVEDVTAHSGLATVLGPEAAGTIAEIVLGSVSHAADVEGLAEEEFLEVQGDGYGDGGIATDGVRVARTCDVDVPAWDIFVSAGRFPEVWDGFIEAGAVQIGAGVWDTLRVEAGRPAFGGDMDDSTILSETGLVDRAVDHTKGCYTGQEVIVRIRDRGHVNRSLRGLLLAEGPAPKLGVELFRGDRVVGEITSAVESPSRAGPIGLGYVHREILHGKQVTVGSPEGPSATVRELGLGWTSA